jgi:hypothetical protein
LSLLPADDDFRRLRDDPTSAIVEASHFDIKRRPLAILSGRSNARSSSFMVLPSLMLMVSVAAVLQFAKMAALAHLIGTPGLSWSERQVSIAFITAETVLVATGCSPQRLRRSFATPLERFEQVNRWMFVFVRMAYDPVAMFLVEVAIAMERRRKGGRRESETRDPRREDRRPVGLRRSPQAHPQRPRGRALPRRFADSKSALRWAEAQLADIERQEEKSRRG